VTQALLEPRRSDSLVVRLRVGRRRRCSDQPPTRALVETARPLRVTVGTRPRGLLQSPARPALHQRASSFRDYPAWPTASVKRAGRLEHNRPRPRGGTRPAAGIVPPTRTGIRQGAHLPGQRRRHHVAPASPNARTRVPWSRSIRGRARRRPIAVAVRLRASPARSCV
jgi:hypothetical protein